MKSSSENGTRMLLWAISLQIVAIILFLFWVFVAIFSPMFADGGVNDGIYVLIIFCNIMPFIMVLLSILTWIGYRKRHTKLLSVISGVQLLSIIPLIVIG